MRLQNRVALITGAGRGIGAATALRLAEEGAQVVVNDINPDHAEQSASAIRDAGFQAVAHPCDISDRASVEGLIQRAVEEYGKLDILVNNAGVIRDNLVHRMTDDDWDTVMNVHLKGAFYCSQAAQKFMVPARFGKIVNFSSTSALGNRGQLNYATAKAGLQGFTKTLAIELGKFNINVNAVAPGFIETDMTRATAERMGVDFEDFKKYGAEQSLLGRTGKPIDIANAVLFLVSEESSFITGQVLYVRGGI